MGLLSALVEEHNQNQRDHKKSQEQKRKEAISAADDLIQAIKNTLHDEIKTVYFKQRHLRENSRIMTVTYSIFRRKTMKFFHDLKVFTTLLKELGDVEHWASVMEKELLEINLELDNLLKLM